MKYLFDKEVNDELVTRVNRLTPETQRVWGKMDVSQMCAHCNVPYEMVYTDKHPKPGAVKKFFIQLFAKSMVVGDKPYPRNGRTAPEFVMTEEKDFEKEKSRLLDHLNKTYELGEAHFDGKESHAMGNLSKEEWSTMFHKHLDHHLTQFGV